MQMKFDRMSMSNWIENEFEIFKVNRVDKRSKFWRKKTGKCSRQERKNLWNFWNYKRLLCPSKLRLFSWNLKLQNCPFQKKKKLSSLLSSNFFLNYLHTCITSRLDRNFISTIQFYHKNYLTKDLIILWSLGNKCQSKSENRFKHSKKETVTRFTWKFIQKKSKKIGVWYVQVNHNSNYNNNSFYKTLTIYFDLCKS